MAFILGVLRRPLWSAARVPTPRASSSPKTTTLARSASRPRRWLQMRQESRSSNAEVSRETVAYTARLANLSYTDRELDELVPAFREMLHFMDTINSVPEEALAAADEEFGGADVTVTFTTPLHSVLREDAPRSFAEPDALLDAFPDKEGDMLRIPKITSDA